MTDLMEIKESTLQVKDLKNKKLVTSCNKIGKAILNIKKDSLVVAEQLYIIKTEELFKDDFENFSKFSDTVGIGKARASKLTRVWERLLLSNGVLETFNATQIEEMLPLDQSTNIEVVEENKITPDMKAVEIRKIVKEISTPVEEKEETGETTETETGTEETTEIFTSVKIAKNGYMFKATEEEILTLLKKHFTTA